MEMIDWPKKCLPGLLVLIFAFLSTYAWGAGETLQYGRFGTLTLYRNIPQPSHVVLFVSGDGGWNLGVIDMAQSLASLDALVVGIDINHYLRELARSTEKCSYPAADFESLSKFVQKKLAFDHYRTPVLVGYSSGATLVYALLAQAPPNTFRGAISMGFCPDLPLNKPFCPGHGLKSEPNTKIHGYNFLPVQTLDNPWTAFQGTIDQVCNAGDVEAYVKQVGNGQIVLLPKVGHGFSVQKNWLPQFRETFTRLVKNENRTTTSGKSALEIADLPLVEIPVKGSNSDLMAVIFTGDGGWASLDRDLGTALAAKGIPVVGLNTLQYFWTVRTPEQAAKDAERILGHYLTAWKSQKALLIGYSLGADVLPFLAARLPQDLRQKIAAVVLIGPGKTASFEFHLSDWLGGSSPGALPIAPEMEKIKGMKVLCFFGKEESDSLCRDPSLEKLPMQILPQEGGHHFGGNYLQIADQILVEVMANQAE